MSRKTLAPHFVMVLVEMLKDPQWKRFSSSAKILWIYMRSKFNEKNYSEITLTYGEMKGILSTRTMSRALKELEKEDWIEKTKHGGLYGGSCQYKFKGSYSKFYYRKRFKL